MRLVRSRAGRELAGWFFAHMSFAVPFKRLRQTETLLAFHHPRPSYALHILLVPRRRLASLLELSPDDADFTGDLFATVRSLVEEFDLEKHGFRLISNGGIYQDVPHLHFHLVSDL